MNRRIILSALAAISASLSSGACQDKSSDLKEVKSKNSKSTSASPKGAKLKQNLDSATPANTAAKNSGDAKAKETAKTAGQAQCAPGGCAPGKCGGGNHEGTKAKTDDSSKEQAKPAAPEKKDKS